MNNDKLYLKLIEYKDSDIYPFHMPGHKRNLENETEGLENISPYKYDITEIDGFDNLHAPTSIIKDRMKEVSGFYGSRSSYFLVNGSTCGILSAISATCNKKKTILMARNSHKAAYNGIFLNKLNATYVYPNIISDYGINGGIDASDIEGILNTEEIGAVFITSPTYEGIVSDIKSISSVCHKFKVPLIVDEAHGAHFSMHNNFPVSSLKLGADIVIQSLHKTLPSLTQTAILHIGKESIINEKDIERYLGIYQSSSPSYVLLGSIDRCLDKLMNETFLPFEVLSNRINDFINKCSKLANIKILDKSIVKKNRVFDFDLSKIVIFPISNSYTGHNLYEKLLQEYHIQLEMSSLYYVIAMTSIMDTEEGFDRLYEALEKIDREIGLYDEAINNKRKYIIQENKKAIVCNSIDKAIDLESDTKFLNESEGKASSDYIYLYPPGIPLVAPGEMFTREIIEYIDECVGNGLNVIGLIENNTKVNVIK